MKNWHGGDDLERQERKLEAAGVAGCLFFAALIFFGICYLLYCLSF